MKKDTLRAIAALAVMVVVYHVLAFAIPFVKSGAFWLSYVFTLLALAVGALSIYIAFFKKPDAKSKFYGFPIARIGVVYALIQILVGLVFMAVGQWIPGWIPAVIYVLGLGVALIGLISAEAVVEEIHVQDVKLKKDVSVMRGLQSKVNPLAGMCDDADAADAVKDFAEAMRYSDPVSGENMEAIEGELSAVVDELQQAVVDGDAASVKQLCRKATTVLAERNRLCKLSKV